MESIEVKHNSEIAETLYVSHPTSSYGIFCFNSGGDLFLNSDWGFYGFAWRAYGKDFKGFLGQCNSDYIVGKFEINYREVNNGKKMPAHRVSNVKVLVDELIKFCKENPNTTQAN